MTAVRDLSALGPFSALANLLIVLASALAVSAALSAIASGAGASGSELWPRDSSGVLRCASAILYAYEGVALVLPVEAEYTAAERRKGSSAQCAARSFERVLLGAMSFLALAFALVGCVCAAGFPTIGQGSVTAFLALR